jgi:Flp pilus assembly secretin CpaC
MTPRMVRRGGAKAPAFGLLLLAAATLSTAMAHAAEQLSVTLDQATLFKLPEKVATIVIGNPLIADIAVQSGGLVVVTGKGYGSTNMIVLDRAGAILMERAIVVRGPDAYAVSVYRGVERETYSCTPNCERRITLGDSADYFTRAMSQSSARDGAALAGGNRAPAR